VVEEKFAKAGLLFFNSNDDFRVSLVHHEYPTPFRCDMSGKDFKIVDDCVRTGNGGLFRRGHYDLVVLNPAFVEKYDAVVVAGKNYRRFCEVRDGISVSPLLWICEIVFGAHVEDGLPKNWEKLVLQDALKVKESLSYNVGKANFAVHGSVIVFFGIKPNKRIEQIKEEIKSYNAKHGLNIRVQTAI
jgi:hypothetical protein